MYKYDIYNKNVLTDCFVAAVANSLSILSSMLQIRKKAYFIQLLLLFELLWGNLSFLNLLGFSKWEEIKFVFWYTRPFVQHLLANMMHVAILILDGMYNYIHPQIGNLVFSSHKHRPHFIPVMVVWTDGYIPSVFGPNLALVRIMILLFQSTSY